MSDQMKRRARRWKKKRANIPGYSSERETAEELGLSLRTLRLWRATGRGPAYVKFADSIFYPDEGRAAWLKAHTVVPVQEFVAA